VPRSIATHFDFAAFAASSRFLMRALDKVKSKDQTIEPSR